MYAYYDNRVFTYCGGLVECVTSWRWRRPCHQGPLADPEVGAGGPDPSP